MTKEELCGVSIVHVDRIKSMSNETELILAKYLKSVDWDETIDYEKMAKHIIGMVNEQTR